MPGERAQLEERAFYREIIRRARRMRERAADSLKRTRESRQRPSGAVRAQKPPSAR